jgi:translation initiation factor IF-3
MQAQQNSQNFQHRIRVNFQIKVPQVRVIQDDGTSLGVMNTKEALKLAQDQGLDLVEINPKSSPPVCKIYNYGKFKYEEKKKQAESRKKQKSQELKELTFRPNTDFNDLNHKLKSAKEFLSDGHKVKFTVRFRGREVTHPQIAHEKLSWILQELSGLVQVDAAITLEGKFMFMTVAPSK